MTATLLPRGSSQFQGAWNEIFGSDLSHRREKSLKVNIGLSEAIALTTRPNVKGADSPTIPSLNKQLQG